MSNKSKGIDVGAEILAKLEGLERSVGKLTGEVQELKRKLVDVEILAYAANPVPASPGNASVRPTKFDGSDWRVPARPLAGSVDDGDS